MTKGLDFGLRVASITERYEKEIRRLKAELARVRKAVKPVAKIVDLYDTNPLNVPDSFICFYVPGQNQRVCFTLAHLRRVVDAVKPAK